MNKLFAVIRREFIERVRTKAFIIGTLIVPVMFFVFGYLPTMLMNRDTRSRVVVLLDASSGTAGDSVEAALRRLTLGGESARTPRYNLVHLKAGNDLTRLRDSLIAQVGIDAPGSLDGVLVLTDAGADSGWARYYGSNVASFSEMRQMERTLEPVLRVDRMMRKGADSTMVAAAAIRFDLQAQKVTKGRLTGESGESSFLLAYITSFIMYISLIMYGVQVMGAVLEEKSNRIVEVLISSITPFQLLFGKIMGVAGAGLVQLAIWFGAAALGSRALASRAAANIDPAALEGAAQNSTGIPNVPVELIVIVLVFFLLGFLLYSALYAAVGAMCSSQQETQQAAQPVTILLALGFILMFALINDPGSNMARIVSFIPFFSPIVIPVRYAISPLPLTEVLGAMATTILGIVAVAWVAGRIYRVGILSYGKKPSLKEVLRWVRTS